MWDSWVGGSRLLLMVLQASWVLHPHWFSLSPTYHGSHMEVNPSICCAQKGLWWRTPNRISPLLHGAPNKHAQSSPQREALISIVLVRKQICPLPQRKTICLSFKVVCSTDIFGNIAQMEGCHNLLQKSEGTMEKLSPQKGHTSLCSLPLKRRKDGVISSLCTLNSIVTAHIQCSASFKHSILILENQLESLKSFFLLFSLRI